MLGPLRQQARARAEVRGTEKLTGKRSKHMASEGHSWDRHTEKVDETHTWYCGSFLLQTCNEKSTRLDTTPSTQGTCRTLPAGTHSLLIYSQVPFPDSWLLASPAPARFSCSFHLSPPHKPCPPELSWLHSLYYSDPCHPRSWWQTQKMILLLSTEIKPEVR